MDTCACALLHGYMCLNEQVIRVALAGLTAVLICQHSMISLND